MGKKDITLKDYFSDCRRYADLLNGSMFGGQQMIKEEELQDIDTVQSKSDSQGIVERTNDIAMKQTKQGSVFAVWVVANQEKIDYSMPVRVMLQEALAYDRQLKEIKRINRLQWKQQQDLKKKQGDVYSDSGEFLSGIKKEDRLYPIITLVVYWGEEKWQGAGCLHDMIYFGKDKEFVDALKNLVPKYPLHFLDLSQAHDYHNFHSEIRMLFELYDRRNDKTEFYKYLQYNEECRQIDEETAWALGKMLNISTEKLKNKTTLKKGGKSDMCRAIEELIADGKAEGDAERIVKSIESTMKNLKVEAVRACEIIGVTLEEYRKAKESTF